MSFFDNVESALYFTIGSLLIQYPLFHTISNGSTGAQTDGLALPYHGVGANVIKCLYFVMREPSGSYCQ